MESNQNMPYEEFRACVVEVLSRYPDGRSWTQIREEANLPQKWPNNKRVRQLEIDVRLIREKKSGKVIWRLPSENKNQSNSR